MEIQSNLNSVFKRISRSAGIITLFVGATVLIGWWLDIQVLKSFFPGFVPMKAGSAAAFVLAGLSLLFAQEEGGSKSLWEKYAGRTAAALVVFIGLSALGEIVFGWNLGFNPLFLKERIGGVFMFGSGIMSFVSAINFLLVGLALIFLSFERQLKQVQFLCVCVLSISLIGFFGYLYGTTQFHKIALDLITISAYSTITFLILALGIIFARPNYGFMALVAGNNVGGSIIRRFMPASIILLTIWGYIHFFVQNSEFLTVGLGFALHAVICIITFSIIIWRVAAMARGVALEREFVTEQLKIERDKLKILLQSIGDAVIAIDRSWNITLWNEGASRFSGWTANEVMGKPFRDFVKLIREGDRKENILFIEDAMITGQTRFLEGHTLLIKKDGKEISVGDSAAPILNKDGEVMGAIIVMRDTTKEREVSSLRSDFSYASHQLRTPVVKALWLLETSLAEHDLKKIKSDIKTAYQSLESVKKLSEELIYVSEVDQRTISPKIEKVNLIDLLSEVVKGAGQKAEDRGVRIIAPQISTPLSINTDQKLLKSALAEILDNAIIYSPTKGEIKIDAEAKEAAVLIEIQNSGTGIASEHQPLVFTKFFRGGNFDTTKIPGAGLGLYIAKEYIKLLNGNIWFRSEGDKKTSFFVSLPL